MESLLARLQGIGWGASSIKYEIAAWASVMGERLSSSHLIDVGAYDGSWSSAFLKSYPYAKVTAFEPSPAPFGELKSRLGNLQAVRCEQLALWNCEGVLQLWSDAESSQLSSLFDRNLAHLNVRFDRVIDVYATTLDAYFAGSHDQTFVMKIDAEGSELQVLQGAEQLMQSISLIQFEFGGCNIDSRTYFRDFWDLLRGHDFEILRVTPRGPVTLESYSERLERFETTNYIARDCCTVR